MCGIAGFINFKKDYLREEKHWREVLDEMNRVQKHRGPDEEGICLHRNCGMAHVRLSILDLARGTQPMTKRMGEHSCTIVYNGEIYNMPVLRRELKQEGVSFETTSDTEVILAGYMLHGAEYVKRLNGIFAFAIWDEAARRLTLFRDPVGVKPFFYTLEKGMGADDYTLVFASELKGIFAYPGIEPRLDKESLQEVLGLGPAKSCGKGVFAGISELLAGHYLVCDCNGLHDECYWQLVSREHGEDYSTTVEKVSWLIEDAVKMQMLSDIPISTFLSGGVDSSLVTAICAKELHSQGKQLRTFSFDFKDNTKYFKSNDFQPSQDRPWVDKMVDYAKTEHVYLECDKEKQADYLYHAVDARDLPCMTDIESSMLYFCSQVVDYNKVTLTGECADEIFGGYPWFHKKECFEADCFPWSMDISPRNTFLKDEVEKELALEDYAKMIYEKSVAETPRLQGETAVEKRRREISWLNLKWFMVTLLDRMDRTSMYSGLEARVPFADYRIIEYVWNVPWEMKCPERNGVPVVKGLLRAAGEKYLPEEVLYRRKSPYPKTYDPGYEKLLSGRLEEVLNDASSPILPLVDKKKVLAFLSSVKDYGKPWYGQLMAGPQLIAYWLQINYWMKKWKLSV